MTWVSIGAAAQEVLRSVRVSRMKSIKFAATYGDEDEAHRIERLARVYRVALGKVRDASPDPSAGQRFAGAIFKMHDHKGELVVFWRSDADVTLWADFIQQAWNAESECLIVHGSLESQAVLRTDGDAPSATYWFRNLIDL